MWCPVLKWSVASMWCSVRNRSLPKSKASKCFYQAITFSAQRAIKQNTCHRPFIAYCAISQFYLSRTTCFHMYIYTSICVYIYEYMNVCVPKHCPGTNRNLKHEQCLLDVSRVGSHRQYDWKTATSLNYNIFIIFILAVQL